MAIRTAGPDLSPHPVDNLVGKLGVCGFAPGGSLECLKLRQFRDKLRFSDTGACSHLSQTRYICVTCRHLICGIRLSSLSRRAA